MAAHSSTLLHTKKTPPIETKRTDKWSVITISHYTIMALERKYTKKTF